MHHRRKAYLYLTLPCSNLERFISKWLLTSVGFAVSLLVAYYILGLVGAVFNMLVFHTDFHSLNLWQLDLWTGISKYIILQSVILLGAIYFNRYTLIKTALVASCFLLLVSMFTVITGWFIYPDYILTGFNSVIAHTLEGSYFIFWIILAPFCWYLTYLKLTESEGLKKRKLCTQGFLQKDIAKQFCVDPSIVSEIKNNKIWRHI